MRWIPAYVGIGSNLEDPVRQAVRAFDLLAALPDTELVARSSLYRSAPFGTVPQPDFINAVAALLTRLTPGELLRHLKAAERAAGRQDGGPRWGPRPLDLDLLAYGRQVVREPELTVPHPGIGERNFVLLPLRELAPDLEIPALGRVASIPVDERQPRIARLEPQGQLLDSEPDSQTR